MSKDPIETDFISGAVTALRRRAQAARDRALEHSYTVEKNGLTITAMWAEGVIDARNAETWDRLADEFEEGGI